MNGGHAMFHIGDKVVYPMHGAGTIESIEEKEMFGDKSEYYIIKMPMNGMKLMVPTKTATNVGVREVSDGSVTEEVFKILEKPKQEYVHENNWSKRYRANVDKIKADITAKEAEIAQKESAITAKQADIANKQAEVDSKIDEISKKQQDIDSKTTTIANNGKLNKPLLKNI